MKFRECREEETNIDLTPFIDVVFMLLLFFVVSTTLFKSVNKLSVRLPEANAEALKDKKTIEVGVDMAGNYFINGNPIGGNDSRKLKAFLNKKLEKDKSLCVVLVGEAQAPHQSVVTVLEVASQLDIAEVKIVAKSHKT